MDADIKAVIIGLASIAAAIAAFINETYRIYILVLYPVAITLYILSSYIKKTEENEKQIKEMNKKLEIYERLARLEGRVFK